MPMLSFFKQKMGGLVDVRAEVAFARHVCQRGAPNRSLLESAATIFHHTSGVPYGIEACIHRAAREADFDAISLSEAIRRVERALEAAGFAVTTPPVAALGRAMHDDALAAHRYTDAQVVVEHAGLQTTFRAHSCVLAAGSAYFEAMLACRKVGRGAACEGEPLVLRDLMPPAAFAECLRFIYTGAAGADAMPPALLADVVLAADALRMRGLVLFVAHELVTDASAPVVLDVACALGESAATAALVEACAARIAACDSLEPHAFAADDGGRISYEAVYAIVAAAMTGGTLNAARVQRVGAAALAWMRLSLCELHARLATAAETVRVSHTTLHRESFERSAAGARAEPVAFCLGTRRYTAHVQRAAEGAEGAEGALELTVVLVSNALAPQMVTVRCGERSKRALLAFAGARATVVVEAVGAAEAGGLSFEVEADVMFDLCSALAVLTFETHAARVVATFDSSVLAWVLRQLGLRLDAMAALRGALERPTSLVDRMTIVSVISSCVGNLRLRDLAELLDTAPAVLAPDNEGILDVLVRSAIEGIDTTDDEREAIVALVESVARNARHASPSKRPKHQDA